MSFGLTDLSAIYKKKLEYVQQYFRLLHWKKNFALDLQKLFFHGFSKISIPTFWKVIAS